MVRNSVDVYVLLPIESCFQQRPLFRSLRGLLFCHLPPETPTSCICDPRLICQRLLTPLLPIGVFGIENDGDFRLREFDNCLGPFDETQAFPGYAEHNTNLVLLVSCLVLLMTPPLAQPRFSNLADKCCV